MTKSIGQRSKEAVHHQYNCEYPCGSYECCIFGSGSNTSYDCEECGADEFQNGYIKGAIEQRKRDIELFGEWLKDMLALQHATPDFVEEALERLKQAMEEEQ